MESASAEIRCRGAARAWRAGGGIGENKMGAYSMLRQSGAGEREGGKEDLARPRLDTSRGDSLPTITS